MIYFWQSKMHWEHINYIVAIIFAVSIPAILGAQLFYKISEQQFKHIVLSLLFASGIILVFTSIHKFYN